MNCWLHWNFLTRSGTSRLWKKMFLFGLIPQDIDIILSADTEFSVVNLLLRLKSCWFIIYGSCGFRYVILWREVQRVLLFSFRYMDLFDNCYLTEHKMGLDKEYVRVIYLCYSTVHAKWCIALLSVMVSCLHTIMW